ncbi:MAG: hypothetical protein PVI04_10720, partial [Anaerolineales bacterium]
MTKSTAPYGSWESPISAELVAKSGTGSSSLPREIHVDGDSVYWIEQRPEQGGRYVIVRLQTDGSKQVVTPSAFNVRSRVHEYGGGAYCIRAGTIIFVNDQDQRLYRQDPERTPHPITPAPAVEQSHRYADGAFSPDGKWMLWVRERHEDRLNVQNEIVLIASDGSSTPRLLVSGHDFFSNPRFSPDGTSISWLCWDHPDMPWDSTEVWTATIDLEKLKVRMSKKVAGGEDVSIFQPEWSPDGWLYFISDLTGWWNIYRENPDGSIENVCPIEAEFGYPQWLFGQTKYTFLNDKEILASYKVEGQAKLGLVDVTLKTVTPITAPYTTFESPSMRSGSEGTAWFFAGAPDFAPALCRFDLATRSTGKVVDVAGIEIEARLIAVPDQIEFINR